MMERLRSFAWLLVAGAAVVAAILGFPALLRRRERERAQHEAAEKLKLKVAEAKAQRAGEQAALATEVARVEAQAEADKGRDPVEVANALIAEARGKP